jgi:hypothetical protein
VSVEPRQADGEGIGGRSSCDDGFTTLAPNQGDTNGEDLFSLGGGCADTSGMRGSGRHHA